MKIIITGTVGVGKSTVSELLNTELNKLGLKSQLLLELSEEDNPLLKLYYDNRPEWSFLIQLDFVLKRFKTLFKISQEKEEKTYIFDRHFLDDFIIANMRAIKADMGELQRKVYLKVNEELFSKITDYKPDFLFLLKAPFATIIERIQKRGRSEEKSVDLKYWEDMYHQYYLNPEIQSYLKKGVKKVIIVDTLDKNIKEVVDEITSSILANGKRYN